MNKLPYPNIKANADIQLDVSVGISNQGKELSSSWSGDVVFNEHHKRVQTKDGVETHSVGKVFIFHDIFEGVYELTGSAMLRGKKHKFSGSRFYNPDGTVHHVELELMQ